MVIRRGREEDIDRLVELGRELHLESRYAWLPFEDGKVRESIYSFLGDPQYKCGLVAEENGVLIGALAGYLADYFFCNSTVASDAMFFVARSHRGSMAAGALLRAFREWAKSRGAQELCIGVSSGIDEDKTGVFYEVLGLTRGAVIYKQRL
jgi:GNAT superfamily N-acetyltransferase